MGIIDSLKQFFSTEEKSNKDIPVEEKPKKVSKAVQGYSNSRRTSNHPRGVDVSQVNQLNNLGFIKPSFNIDAIKLIRQLRGENADIGLVINDMKELSNTGHKIRFSADTPNQYAELMRQHIKEVSTTWLDGINSIDGIINKLISQIWIGGAVSVEAIPRTDLKGLSGLGLINPEEIRVKLNPKTRRYEFYQIGYGFNTFKKSSISHVKLNRNQYIYYALAGDEEVPYGIPPYLTALESLETQKDMKENIAFIVDQIGIMGFLEFLMEKPMQESHESDSAYVSRLESGLRDLRKEVLKGFKDGVIVGYQGDHESTFHSTTKNISNLDSIFNLNQVQVANGLKTHPTFLGVNTGTTESSMSIVFTKMLSQLNNVQSILSSVLEQIFKLELRLSGFNNNYIKSLKVEFNPSTITDLLKKEQSGEIKRRNLKNDYLQGLISQETYAEELGYGKPDQKEPRQIEGESSDTVKKANREKQKDDSDRRVRDKNKPQPKRKDLNTKNP
jgi:hypothetical protein